MMKNKGFTLIETVIVIAVIGVLVAIVALPMSKFRDRQSLQNSTNALVSVLSDARAKTFAGLENSSYGVHLMSDRIILFKGQIYSEEDESNEEYLFESSVRAEWTLSDGGDSIFFDRLKGTTAQYGTITLRLPDGSARIVTVTALGTVSRD